MKNVLVFGAGRSSLYLIEYLADYCATRQWQVIVCDRDASYARQFAITERSVKFMDVDIQDTVAVSALVESSEMVVSLLPATLHIQIAGFCLACRKNLATASYISEEMKLLHEQARDHDLLFMNECGLDPGIDHMSAMQMLDNIRDDGGVISGFESYCGGLVADEDDGNNPWKYKFSWSPRNVVLAGQGSPAQYMQDKKLKLVPYHQIFRHVETFGIEGYRLLEGYPNRDSLKYMSLYGFDNISHMIRGTLRKQGYASAWQVFIELGMTDDTTVLEFAEGTTMIGWLNTYLPVSDLDAMQNLKQYSRCTESDLGKIMWLGLFTDEKLPILKGTSAQILEEILKEKWKLDASDKDLVVMLHRIRYTKDGQGHVHQATMVLKGESNTHTAMAKTVGLPLAITCKLMLENRIRARGVVAPVTREIYEPVLEELRSFNITFDENGN